MARNPCGAEEWQRCADAVPFALFGIISRERVYEPPASRVQACGRSVAAMTSPWTLIVAALLLTLLWWPLRTMPRRTMWSGTLVMWAILAGLPWLADRTSLVGFASLALISAAALPAKLVDSAVVPEVWTARRWREWVLFLL